QDMAKTVGNMGIALWYLGDYQRALECFTQQLHSAQEIGDRRVMSIACGNIAEVYRHLGDYPRALACYARQLQIAVEVGNRRGITLAVGYLALTYALQGRPSEAEALVRQAIALGLALQIPYYL